MRIKIIILAVFLFTGFNSEAQILKKLKKTVEKTAEKVLVKKTEETTEKAVENSIDGVTNPKSSSGNTQAGSNVPTKEDPDANQAKLINTEAKRAFYTKDVIVTTSENDAAGSSFYFDADNLAMRGMAPDTNEEMFTDSEGYQYAFNDSNNRWEKTGLMRGDAMSFMMPAMSMSLLQLPPGPMLDATDNAKANGMNLNTFMIVEWAFIYKPEHFRNEDYTESKVNGGSKFSYTDPEYKGSYVIFDSQDRLSQALIKTEMPEGVKTGIFNFAYAPVQVNIPSAVEVKMPFQDLYMQGLDMPNEDNGMANNTRGESSDSGVTHKQVKSMQENMKNSDLGTEDLPATYEFDWEYKLKMDMTNQKQDPLDLIMLLKKGTNYQGVTVKNPQTGGLDEATMVFDLDMNALVMFVESGGSKFLQIHPMQDANGGTELGDMDNLQIRELPDKTIMGYISKGIEMENDKYIVQVYHTTQAPIEMANLFNFSGAKNMNIPDIDPRLVKQFSEGLVTEMRYTDKKKAKNNLLLTAQSLEQKKTSLNKNEYQNLSFMGQLKSMKN